MRKQILSCILIFSLALLFSTTAKAIKAYPFPITVTQPDGTTLTIQIHGDEFLHWTTCGSSLISKGEDGFYYHASFDTDGYIVRSSSRISPSGIRRSSSSEITPPPSAIARALDLRSKMMKHTSSKGISRRSEGSISLGKKPFLVMMIQFSDLSFTVDAPHEMFENLLNQKDYTTNGSTGSAKEYYYENSNGLFDPEFVVAGPITASKSYSYYGSVNDQRVVELLVEACTKLNEQGFDFSPYDNDGDGVLDNIFFYYAGYNEAEGGGEETIWPHSWNVSYFKNVSFDGKKLATYACTSEYSGSKGSKRFCGISTFCHEFGHVLGLPDFYDIDYAKDGEGSGLYNYSLMCVGCYNNDGKTPPYLNMIEKNLLGWMDIPEYISANGSYSLKSIDQNESVIFPTTTKNEFYLIETRRDVRWDHYLPGFGMILYHVDMSDNNVGGMTAAQRWSSWEINNIASHQCFDLVPAFYPEKNMTDQRQIPFPGPSNNTSFTGESSPASISWAKEKSGYNLTNIAFNGEIVTFDLVNDNLGKIFYDNGYNAIEYTKSSYSSGDTFVPKLIVSSKVPKSYTFTFDGNTVSEGSSITLTAGEHIIKAVLTYEDSPTETLIQYIKVD